MITFFLFYENATKIDNGFLSGCLWWDMISSYREHF